MSDQTPTHAPSCADDYDPDSLNWTQALERIFRDLEPPAGREQIPIRGALDRVLAEPVISAIDVPQHRNAAMDGYALAAAELPAEDSRRLAVIGTSWAGRPYPGAVGTGQCVRIMTGAVMPEGTDTVVMQEHVQVEGDAIRLGAGHQPGQNVREAGEDIGAGQPVMDAGTRITPARLGLLASLGIVEVSVHRRLRVAYFSTGDELRSIGQPLEPGAIYDSNRYTLYGMLTRLGVEVIDMGVVRDEPEALAQAFRDGAACADVLLTSGGVSVGEADLVKDTLTRLGEINFWKVAMKPGRPLAFGRIGATVFFGLPGNPVSVMVTFYQFVQPALRRLMGEPPQPLPPTFTVPCVSRLRKRPGRMEFQRGVLERDAEGRLVVRKTGFQGSGILRSMSEADCFIILDTDQGDVDPGTPVQVQPFFALV